MASSMIFKKDKNMNTNNAFLLFIFFAAYFNVFVHFSFTCFCFFFSFLSLFFLCFVHNKTFWQSFDVHWKQQNERKIAHFAAQTTNTWTTIKWFCITDDKHNYSNTLNNLNWKKENGEQNSFEKNEKKHKTCANWFCMFSFSFLCCLSFLILLIELFLLRFSEQQARGESCFKTKWEEKRIVGVSRRMEIKKGKTKFK